jgi:hypothetical protein
MGVEGCPSFDGLYGRKMYSYYENEREGGLCVCAEVFGRCFLLFSFFVLLLWIMVYSGTYVRYRFDEKTCLWFEFKFLNMCMQGWFCR